jgi:hypothetical protein
MHSHCKNKLLNDASKFDKFGVKSTTSFMSSKLYSLHFRACQQGN